MHTYALFSVFFSPTKSFEQILNEKFYGGKQISTGLNESFQV